MRKRSRRLGIIVGAVAVAGAVIVAFFAVTRTTSPEARVAAERPSDAPASSTTSPPSDPTRPAAWRDIAWLDVVEVFGDEPGPLLRIAGMTPTRGGLLAWGKVPADGRNQFNDIGAVFRSPDGRSWDVATVDAGVAPANTSDLAGLAPGSSGYLAYGSVCCTPEELAVWRSADAVSWERVALEGDIDSRTRFHEVVQHADRWIAIGTADGTSRIWVSADGVTWSSVFEVEGGFAGNAVADLAVVDGRLVVVGSVTGDDDTFDAAIWTSAAGDAWERIALGSDALEGAGESHLSSIVAFSGGWLAIGIHGPTEMRQQCEAITAVGPLAPPPPPTALSCGWGTDHLWLSPDGQRWERIDVADLAGEHPIEFRIVVAGGPGLVLLGESSAAPSPDTAVFVSADGRTWRPIGRHRQLASGLGIGLAVNGERIVALTERWTEDAGTFREAWIGAAD